MPTPLEMAESAAMLLSPDERVELIERLARTVAQGGALGPGWEAEIERRLQAADHGTVSFLPADEVMAELSAHILSRRSAT